MQYYIYKITNKINGKIYIGQHKVPLIKENFRRYMGKGIAIQEAIKKYGKENFDKEILEYIDDDEKHELVSIREKFWIKEFNCMSPNGYNISPGGEGRCTRESAIKGIETKRKNGTLYKSEATRQKMSNAAKGKVKSEIHKQHLSEHHHLRTLHKVQFEHDGHVEETYDSIKTLAIKYNFKSSIELKRASEYGKFKNGILVLDLIKPEIKERQKMIQFGLFQDPIKNDIVSYYTLRSRKSNNASKNEIYKNLDIYNCFIKYNNE